MKKILMAVFAALVTVAWVLPAMAVDTTFYGTYRVRLFATNNAADYNSSGDTKTYGSGGSTVTTTSGANPTDNNSWIDQRFRLSVESKASDNLRGFVQLQIGNNGTSASSTGMNRSSIWGTLDAYGSEVVARQAYISFNAGPVRVKAGRQVFGDAPDGGQSFRVSDDNQYYGLLDGGLILIARTDAVILTTQKSLDPLNLLFGYAKLTEQTTASTNTGNSDRDNTLYILQATAAPSDTLTAGGYFLYDRDRTTVSPIAGTGQKSPWWLGGGVTANLDPINLKAHVAYLGGKYEKGCNAAGGTDGAGKAIATCGLAATDSATDLKYSAYAVDVDVSGNVGPAKVGFAAGIGSGDKSTQDTKSKTFMGVAGSYGNQLGARPAIFFDSGEVSNGGAALNTTNSNGISQSTLGNVTFAELYASFKATDELTLNGLAAGFWNTEKKVTTGTNTSSAWDSKLGTEVDLTAVYKLYKELALVGQAAWFLPGDGILQVKDQAGNYSGFASDDAVSEYFAKIQYDF